MDENVSLSIGSSITTIKNYSMLTVKDLKAELVRRNLSTQGLKANLVERLEHSDETPNAVDRSADDSVDRKSNQQDAINSSTHEEEECLHCRKSSIDMAEVRLELAMLWAEVNKMAETPSHDDNAELLRKENIALRNEVKLLKEKLRVYDSKSTTSHRLEQNGKEERCRDEAHSISNSPSRSAFADVTYGNQSNINSQLSYNTQLKTYKSNNALIWRKQNTVPAQGKQNEDEMLVNMEQKLSKVTEERNSLRTSLKLIMQDFSSLSTRQENEIDDNSEWQSINQCKSTTLNYQGTRPLSTENKFASLSDENEAIIIDDELNSKSNNVDVGEKNLTTTNSGSNSRKSKGGKPTKKTNGKNSDRNTALTQSQESKQKESSSPGFTAVIGDSLLKDIKQHLLSKSTKTRVSVKSFAGSTVKDMQHYLVPTLLKKPKHVILHVGTNDLPSGKATEIIKGIKSLSCLIQKSCPEAKVTVSSLIVRNDDKATKVTELNALLEAYCTKTQINFLDNRNIGLEGLNGSGVHLNKKGNSVLATNLISYIKTF